MDDLQQMVNQYTILYQTNDAQRSFNSLSIVLLNTNMTL